MSIIKFSYLPITIKILFCLLTTIFIWQGQIGVARLSNIDLILEKNFAEEFVIAGAEPQQIFLKLRNQGDEAAKFIRVTDKVDSRLNVTAVNCGAVDNLPGTDLSLGNFVECLYSDLPPNGGSAAITITFSVDPAIDAAIVPNTASAEDEAGHRRNAFGTIEIVEDGLLALEMFFTDSYVEAGSGPYILNLTTRNSGYSNRTNVHVTNTLDHRLAVAQVDCGPAGINRSRGQVIDCAYGQLSAGDMPETITITYSAQSTQLSGSVVNVATALDDDGNGAQAFGSLNIIGDLTGGVETPVDDPPSRPTEIELVHFVVDEVDGQPNQRRVEWETSAEHNTLGFNILRGTEADISVATLINDATIPALGGNTETSGDVNSYRFNDTSALAEINFFYWLVEVETDQTEYFYGPIQIHPSERNIPLDEVQTSQKIFMPIIIQGIP